ncbi:bifunctional adenosylcobinamide kinase/adenosylcobinamide-phosphate guanylyltransferase [Marinobacter sp. NP-4(2019)]|uniref:bifunctional adenosylcobinamide kinase/adenosylcobinamide-phosphate guanylyltransferase n=1 Tax=Marinobacter sp. NP-4(2019) TaxID=2488665 RepID=UPI000FC3ED79|nr:bifunctional adenosylcobinamide kinase/adenosylcobinamide-phosphate guanylyltransferase [Marinobacter sp. NP-4(2019)]AZT82346.1 bifunctional adenosylcobinamide kinase/adenosylcobinamide-phosphate guanylyltransferase [Marinobacter sp. NP-4(2019)]
MGISQTLVIGGIRSGKTALAERLATESGDAVVYVATATVGDEEMAQRVKRHVDSRPARWGLAEEPLRLASVLKTYEGERLPPFLLVDCMSLWVSNLLFAGGETFGQEREAFLEALRNYPGSVAIVSNEVGLGTIGMDPLTRRFCDELGWLNQAIAATCDRVVMSVAGQPLWLKG